jgi:hypothetical protein
MIISKLHLFKVKREPFFGHAVELDKPLFCETPKALDAVDVNLAAGKMFLVVNLDMPVSAEHQSVVAPEFVGVNDAASSDHFDRKIKQRLGFDVTYHFHVDLSVSLEDSEYGDLAGGASPALAFSSSAEITFVKFDLAVEPILPGRVSVYRLADYVRGFQNRGITYGGLFGDFSGRYFKFKELQNPQPFFETYFDFVYPASGEVVKCVFTSWAAVSFAQKSVYSVTAAGGAKNVTFFPAVFSYEKSGSVFAFSDELKGFKFH